MKSSLDDWDDKMQIECARGFIEPLKKNVSYSGPIHLITVSLLQLVNEQNR